MKLPTQAKSVERADRINEVKTGGIKPAFLSDAMIWKDWQSMTGPGPMIIGGLHGLLK